MLCFLILLCLAQELVIDLQEGFSNDAVKVKVDDKIVFNEYNVTTRLLTGIATSIRVPVERDSVKIHIYLSNRNISGSLSITISSDTYVGVSVQNDEIKFITSNSSFGYA